MNNNAKTKLPLSPEEQYLASKLFGRGLFSAIQLSKELEHRDQELGGGMGDVLKIPIPVNRLNKMSNEQEPSPGLIGRALRFNRNPIRTIIGGESGFHDAKREYYQQARENIQREIEQAQKEYLDTLQQIKHGEETPHVDAFCNGLASEATLGDMLPKEAHDAQTASIEHGSIRRLLGDALGTAKKPVQPVIDLGATGLIGTGAGSAYLTYLLKKKLREKNEGGYMHADLPTRIELEPYGK